MEVNSELVSDEENVKFAVTNFLNWYESAYNGISQIQLVRTEGGQYRVDRQEAENFLMILRQSNYLSDEFLHSIEKHIMECDAILLDDGQSEGEPICLDFDLILRTQEVQESLKLIESLQFNKVLVQSDSTETSVKLAYNLSIFLTKKGDKWLITKTFADSSEY